MNRPTDVVVQHPRIVSLGPTPEEQARVDAFARDLAAWMVGDDGPMDLLCRVVVAVAARELGDARTLCAGRPIHAVEATAEAVAALWPLLRELSVGADPDGAAAAAEAEASGLEEKAGAGADAAIRADRALRELDRAIPGLGSSVAPGALRRETLDEVERLAATIERMPAVRDLAERLGRREGEARRPTDDGGSEEITGVVLSGDAARALPSEIALLAGPDTEDLFYQRLVDHRLMSWELRGVGIDGGGGGTRRGPVIACVDTSGSMEGAPEWAAKAVILAVCRAVVPKGRPVHLLLFGGLGEQTEIRLGIGTLGGLLTFLQATFGGGTDFDAPLSRACALLDERDWARADVLVVTDGLARAAPDVVDRVRVARDRHGARVFSVVIGVDVHGVAAFSDEVLRLDPNDAGSTAPPRR